MSTRNNFRKRLPGQRPPFIRRQAESFQGGTDSPLYGTPGGVLPGFSSDRRSPGSAGDYEKLLVNKGKTVRVLEPGHEYIGTALGINDKGELLIRREDGSVTAVYAGEVSVRGVYGYV